MDGAKAPSARPITLLGVIWQEISRSWNPDSSRTAAGLGCPGSSCPWWAVAGQTPDARRPCDWGGGILAGSTSDNDGRAQVSDAIEDAAKQLPGHGDLGHLEDEVATMRDHLGADLHHLLPQAGQRPPLDLARQRQG